MIRFLHEVLQRALPMLIWFALIITGLSMLLRAPDRSPPTETVATVARDLPPNTLLQSGDLRLTHITGRYLVKPIKSVAPIQPSDLSDLPMPLDAPPTRLLLIVPTTRTLIDAGLNAGKQVRLCAAGPIGDATVAFVHCGSNNRDATCSATVEIPASLAANLLGTGFKDSTAPATLHLADSCN